MSALAEVRLTSSQGGHVAAQQAGAVLEHLLALLECDQVTADRAAAEQQLLRAVRELGRPGTAALTAWLVRGPLAVQVGQCAPELQLVGADQVSPGLRRLLEPWQSWHLSGVGS